jgi:endonuclease YncB( thermonuclease family)
VAYLYLKPGGLFVNREIVAKGFGFAYTDDPFQHMEDFPQAERAAPEKKLGL